MDKKLHIAIATFLVIIITFLAWKFLFSTKSSQTPITDIINQTNTNIISIEKPASFEGVEMVTYKNPYGYEIMYPSPWSEVALGGSSTVQEDLNLYHYISPFPINKELHRLLLRPFGCEGEVNGCADYFSKYSKKDYSLLEIYVQMFDKSIVLPDINIPDATKAYIIFPDKTKGVIWTQNASGMRFVVIDNTSYNYRYQITIRDPQAYGLDFTKDILPIISTFRLTTQINTLKF